MRVRATSLEPDDPIAPVVKDHDQFELAVWSGVTFDNCHDSHSIG